MKKYTNLIAGAVFFILCAVIIFLSNIKYPLTFPTQEINPTSLSDYGSLLKGFTFVQEVTLKKNYLNAVELVLQTTQKRAVNENIVTILDSNYQVLSSNKLTSAGLINASKVIFKVTRDKKLGPGSKVYIAFTSLNGDRENHLKLIRNPYIKDRGAVFAKALVSNDIVTTLKSDTQKYPAEGCLVYSTYESDSHAATTWKFILLIPLSLVTLLIIFFRKVKAYMLRIHLKPDRLYIYLGLIFGLTLTIVTPPLQSPDENLHFFRSYQISELHLFKYDNTIPEALPKLTSMFRFLYFNTLVKTTFNHASAQDTILLESAKRIVRDTPNYIFPYIPQAFGIAAGRMLGLAPVWFLFTGRIMSFLISLFVIMLAIRIIPVGKWLLFLLGLMPMTISQLTSLSHDTLAISLSFLLIAMILRYTKEPGLILQRNDWYRLILVAVMLALCKPPYMLFSLLAILIPINRSVNRKQHLIYLATLFILVFVASNLWTLRNAFKTSETTALSDEVIRHVQSASVFDPLLLATNSQQEPAKMRIAGKVNENESQGVMVDSTSQKKQTVFDPAMPTEGVDPPAQQKFILENPGKYLTVLTNSIKYFYDFYLETFVGKLGWLVIPLPKWLIRFYLVMLFFAALFIPAEVNFSWKERLLFLGLALICFILVETAMYIGWTPLNHPWIEGVQGRYFIPFAPLLFLLLSNKLLGPGIDRMLEFEKTRESIKKRSHKKIDTAKHHCTPVFTKALPYVFILTVLISFFVTLFVIINRFYNIFI